jgi:hypothetical protein
LLSWISAQPQGEPPTQLPTGPLIDMDVLVQVLSRLVAPKSSELPILSKFSSLEHEDPKRFLEKCRERLAAMDRWRVRVATRLRGTAKPWWCHPSHIPRPGAEPGGEVRGPRQSDTPPFRVL